jgi:PhzF family phenazine biosynthesis protein
VGIVTEPAPAGVAAFMDQGAPTHLGAPTDGTDRVAAAFSLQPSDLHPELPPEVVSTGLRYLVVPVVEGALERAKVAFDLTSLVHRAGAEYAVLFDVESREIRHWNNDGIVEDIATGSAAGTIAAYCARHGLSEPGTLWALAQGRFTGRPSRLLVRSDLVDGAWRVGVGGDVSFVGSGALEALP